MNSVLEIRVFKAVMTVVAVAEHFRQVQQVQETRGSP